MKFDMDKSKQSRGTQRTVAQITHAFEQVLARRDFAEMQVKEICDEAMIPRSTFYNYFEDKYDLLNYYFRNYSNFLLSQFKQDSISEKETREVLDSLLAAGERELPHIEKILRKNTPNGVLVKKIKEELSELSFYVSKQLHAYDKSEIPVEIIARMNAQAVVLVVDWVFLQHHEMSREKMIDWIFSLCQ